MSDKNKDLYKVLGISRDADIKEIKSAYRRLAKIHHPDHNETKKDDYFKEIQEAYEILKDSVKRKIYDAELMLNENRNRDVFMDVQGYEDLDLMDSISDWFEEMEHRFLYPFSQIDQDLEIMLTKQEARKGGNLSVDLPSYFGFGYGFSSSARRRFNLRIPANIRNGDIRSVYIPELDFWIRVRFSIMK